MEYHSRTGKAYKTPAEAQTLMQERHRMAQDSV